MDSGGSARLQVALMLGCDAADSASGQLSHLYQLAAGGWSGWSSLGISLHGGLYHPVVGLNADGQFRIHSAERFAPTIRTAGVLLAVAMLYAGRGSSSCRTRTYQFSVGTLLMWSETFAHVQQRAGRLCIVDLVGKHGRVRTAPMPAWVKIAIDAWTTAACATVGHVFRPVNRAGAVTGERLKTST